jgi:hypothetical protein
MDPLKVMGHLKDPLKVMGHHLLLKVMANHRGMDKGMYL